MNQRSASARPFCFQLEAAKHKVLAIRDALADDKEYCEALLLKIDHLLGQETVQGVTRSASGTVASPANSKRRYAKLPQQRGAARPASKA